MISYLKRSLKSKNVKKALAWVLFLEVVSVYYLYRLNSTYGELYQAIQDYNTAGIYYSLFTFSLVAGLLVLADGYLKLQANRLAFCIREALTVPLLVEQTKEWGPNYAQRVQEDIKKFGESSVEMGTALLRAGIKLPLFLSVVVNLTAWWVGLSIFAAVAVGTIATRLLSRRLIISNNIQESNEVDLRHHLTVKSFNPIRDQFYVLNRQFKWLNFTQSGIGQFLAILPFVLMIPMYISKTITLGAFMQAVSALGKIVDSLSVILDNRQTWIIIKTTEARLKGIL